MFALNDRQSHLKAMGVHQWYARTKLDGAQSTPDWVLSESEVVTSELGSSVQSIDSKPPIRRTSGVASASQAKSAMDILKVGGQKLDAKEGVAISQASSQVVEKGIDADCSDNPELAGEGALGSFSLVLYQSSQGLIISESVTGQSHPSEFYLLKNILKSKRGLLHHHGDCSFQQVFSWPVFRSLNLQSKQESDLRGVLSAWLRLAKSDTVSSVLYFGSSFPDIKRYYTELLLSESERLNIVTFKHSLADLIQFPQRKAEVWAEICSLYGE